MRLPRLVTIVVCSMGLVAAIVSVRAGRALDDFVIHRIDHCPQWGCDFQRHYMPQIRALFGDHGEVVSGWIYPPFLAIALQWLRPFSDAGALRVWTGVNALLLCVLVLLCRQALRPCGRWSSWTGAVGLVLLSLPVVHGLKWGQISLAVGVGAVFALAHSTRWTPVTLGMLAGVKLYPLAYLAQPGLRREWRRAATALLWALGLGAVLPLVVLGPGATVRFYESAFGLRASALATHGHFAAYLGGQALWPSLRRWFVNGRHVGLPETAEPLIVSIPDATGFLGVASGVAWRLLLALPIAAVVVLTLRQLRVRTLDLPVACSLTLVVVTLTVGPGWHHYYSWLPFALAVVLGRCTDRGHWPLLALAAASWALAALPLALLVDVPAVYFHASAWGATTLSALLAWAALLRVASVQAPRAGAPDRRPSEQPRTTWQRQW